MKKESKRKYREYTDQAVIENAAKVEGLAGLLRSLNLKVAGGNYIHIKKTIQRLEIDTSHWKCKGWNKDQQLKNWSDYSRVSGLKPHLIKKRGNKCEKCSLEKWINELIPLEVHHIDGDRTNNEYENLSLLCPNCHSLTPNFRNRKKHP